MATLKLSWCPMPNSSVFFLVSQQNLNYTQGPWLNIRGAMDLDFLKTGSIKIREFGLLCYSHPYVRMVVARWEMGGFIFYPEGQVGHVQDLNSFR